MHLCDENVRPAASASALTPLRWIGTRAPLDHCLFVDRDGVVNERRIGGYVTAWIDFVWRPGAVTALQRAVDAVALPLVIVTNQSCIGRGFVKAQTVLDVQERMRAELSAAGVPLAAWYCCPHAPDDECGCRKPLPGMLDACRQDIGVDLKRSYLIGDSPSDVAAGKAADCATWLIDTPEDLGAAVDAIIACERARKE